MTAFPPRGSARARHPRPRPLSTEPRIGVGLNVAYGSQAAGGGAPAGPASYLLREDGSYLLREDGSKFLRE